MDDKWSALEKYNLWNGNSYKLGLLRTSYINKIHAFVGNKLVKVLVGQRRSGKSYILRQIASGLISDLGVHPNNILYINKEYLEFDFIDNYQELEKLYQLYREKLNPQGKVYLFFDEIQNVDGWERFVNSHSQDFVEECELFISGSNSRMLSSELATLLSGRYVEFHIFPYNYMEYIQVANTVVGRSSYLSYLQRGGLPELYNLPDTESQKQYVASVKDTVLLRDIVKRKPVRDVRLLDDVFIYLVNNASNLFSIQNVINFFKSKNRKVSYDTLSNYLSYIEEAFLAYKTERYNIKGKEVLAGNCKYYVPNSDKYWFSKFCQDNNIRLVLGGHKHTYSVSWPLKENFTQSGAPISMKPIIQVTQSDLTTYFNSDSLYEETEGSLAGQKFPSAWRTDDNYKQRKHLCTFELVEKITAPVYAMCQATGYKHTSNKELPAPEIPWLRHYFPATIKVVDQTTITATVNAGQRYPFYIIWNVTPTRITGTVKKINYVFTSAGKFNINIQSSVNPPEAIGGNGEENNGNDLILIDK